MWQRREGPEERTDTWRRVYDCKRGVVVERRRKDRSVGPEGRRRVSQERCAGTRIGWVSTMASPLAWSRSVVVVVISWATRPPLNTSNFLSAPPCSLYEFCSIFHYQTLIQRIACVVYDPSALRTTTARDCAKAFFTPPAYRHVTSPYRASYSFP
jgi:hypothetical protein